MTPDYVLAAVARVLGSILPLFRRAPGQVTSPDVYAAYRRRIDELLRDTRAAARSDDLAADLLSIAKGYREASSDGRAVIAGLDRVAVASRAVIPATPRTMTLAIQRQAELGLAGFLEILALSNQALAIAELDFRSYDETNRYRASLGRSFDLAIERAGERGDVDGMRALRDTQGKLTRDLIERGRTLARVVAYETAVPLPAVVIAHRLYQDAGRAGELRLENPAHDHPSFMPMTGRAYSR